MIYDYIYNYYVATKNICFMFHVAADVDPCTEINPCANNGSCSGEEIGFSCTCLDGFTGETCDVGKTPLLV